MLTLNDGRSELWQWDTGRTLAVDADCSQVHFSNKVFGRSIDVNVADGVAIIPDVLLQTDKDLNVWAFVGTAENGYTKISKTFKVNRRNKPADYVFTPQEQILLKDAITIAETAKSSATAAVSSAAAAESSAAAAEKSRKAASESETKAAGSADAAAGSANSAASSATASANSATAAADSASAAARSERAAGASEVKAAESENAAKESEQAAAQSAAAADKRATDAAKSAADADSTANSIKDSMAQISENKEAVSQLKGDIAAITPDDTAVDGKPWTSKKIVDSLCMPFEESGNPVQVYPVENYPLGVRVSWEPVQEGSGTPSPENIRPINGRDSVTVERCGENLFNKDGVSVGAPIYSSDGVLSSYKDVAVAYAKVVPGAQYSIRFRQKDSTTLYIRIAFLTKSKKFIKREYMLFSESGIEIEKQFTVSADCEWIQFGLNNGRTFNYNFDVVFVSGSAPTTYTPYIGQTNTLTLPETVYGGTLDVESGVVTVEYGHIASYAGEPLPGEWISDRDVYAPDATPTTGAQVAYKLAEPRTIQLTPQQITALSGVNTIYTDADGVVATGAEDPKHTITELKNAIISLGGHV